MRIEHSNIRAKSLNLPIDTGGDGSAPTLSFGDGDTGWYEILDDNLILAVGGTDLIQITGGNFTGVSSGNVRLDMNKIPTATSTNIIPNSTDTDTGVSWAGADILSLVAGGESGLRLVQDSWGTSLHIPEITTPTAIADWGAIYAKADNALYFQDGAGVEHTVTIS